MKVLHLLTAGETGGIESLCRDIGTYSKFGNGFCFLSHGGIIYEQMKKSGIETYNLESIGNKFSFRKLKKILALADHYDIVVAHHGDIYLKIYFILIRLWKRKKMVMMVHSCYDPMHLRRYGAGKKLVSDLVWKLSARLSDAVIYVSQAGKNSNEEHFGKIKTKSYIVYNGISPEIIVNGKKHRRKEGPPYLITYIGRLSNIKGIHILIEAVSKLSPSYDIRLSIVGDGPDRKELEQRAADFGISGITHFYGQQTEVEKYLQEASVFVYPSVCQEVFGISIIEALACGIPCVATSVGGIPEIIEDGKSGLLCQPFDPNGLAEKIEFFLTNDATSFVREGKKTAEKYSIIKTIQNLQKIFCEL